MTDSDAERKTPWRTLPLETSGSEAGADYGVATESRDEDLEHESTGRPHRLPVVVRIPLEFK